MVLLGLYVLSIQTRPLGQVIGALIIENGVVLLELLLNHHVALPVELALSGVFLGSILAFGVLLRRLETPKEGA
jgi:hydrogenase-4 membrane subunit HyfE